MVGKKGRNKMEKDRGRRERERETEREREREREREKVTNEGEEGSRRSLFLFYLSDMFMLDRRAQIML